MLYRAIKGNHILTPAGIQKAVVLIRNGVIEDLLPTLPETMAATVTDIEDSLLMPGITDPHVHINEPGRTDWEGFDTATQAAIAGGITMLVDMPLNATPVTTTAAAFDQKVAAANGQLHTHCGFWGGIVPGNAHEINALADKGVLGFKAFLTHSGIDDFPNVTEADLRKAMPLIAKRGLPLLVHAELSQEWGAQSQESGVRSREPTAGGNRSYQKYLASRPKQWEDDAIALMIRLCEETGCRVHIVHLSSARSVEQIAAAKERGLPVTVETAQHYLYFSAETIKDGQTAFKCAPPIRESTNNELLWHALKEGVIDFVATDHSPAPPALKQLSTGDFDTAWGGIASLQLALPALWTAARKRQVPLQDMAKWLCQGPTQLTGQQNRKGIIAKGYDADFVVWNPEQPFIVTEQMLYHKHKVTPYLNETLYGVTEQTWLAGEKVFDRGNFTRYTGKIITH
jgi:allantoinase